MSDIWNVIRYGGVFFIGVLAAALGATVGGGGLLSVPFLIFVGLPPHIAIATNRFGSVGVSVGALAKFSREQKIVWKYVVPFSAIAIVGGYIGARILLQVDEKLLSRIIGFALLALLPLFLIKRDFGITRVHVTRMKEIMGYAVYFLISVWGGFFAAGSGIFNRYAWTHFFGLTMTEVAATGKIPWLVSSLVVLVTFIRAGVVHYPYGVTLFFGMLAGGYFGAHVAVKKGDAWVKRMFVVFVIISAAQLIFSPR